MSKPERTDSLALARAIVESAIRDALYAVTDGAYHRSEQTDEEVWNAANDALCFLDSEHLLAPVPLTEVRSRGTLNPRTGVLHFFGDDSTEYVKYITGWMPVDRAEGDARADQ